MTTLAIEPQWLRSRAALHRMADLRHATVEPSRDVAGLHAELGAELGAHASHPADEHTRERADENQIGPLGFVAGHGLAVINIAGPLSFGESLFTQMGCGVTYEAIRESIAAADTDPRVSRIVLDFNSPGGDVSGITDAANAIAVCGKPITAFVHDMACSAAYWLAAACDEIVATPTAMTGSIGVIVVDYDESERYKDEGVKPVVITTANLKRGYPGEVIDDELVAHTRANIEQVDRLFVDHVAARRGIQADAVSAWEGRVFTGAAGAAAGLVDRIEPQASFYAGQFEDNTMSTPSMIRGAAGQASSKSSGASAGPTQADAAPTDDEKQNQPTTADDLYRGYDDLDEDEKAKFRARLDGDDDDDKDNHADAESGDDTTHASAPDDDTAAAADDDTPQAAWNLSRIEAAIGPRLTGDDRDRCALACLRAGVSSTAGVLEQVIAAKDAQTQAARDMPPAPNASADPIGGGGHGAGSGHARGSARGGSRGGARGGSAEGYLAAVEAEMKAGKLTRAEATKKVNDEQPELRAAYVGG